MTARDLFGLAVRLTGFALVVFSLFDFMRLAELPAGIPLPQDYTPMRVVLAGLQYLLLGVLILVGARLITRLVYGRP